MGGRCVSAFISQIGSDQSTVPLKAAIVTYTHFYSLINEENKAFHTEKKKGDMI